MVYGFKSTFCQTLYTKSIVVKKCAYCTCECRKVVDIHYEDKEMEVVHSVWFKEFGKDGEGECRYIGDEIEWIDGDNFKVKDSRYTDDESSESEMEGDSESDEA